jgi:flagellar biosynthesis chaperone FliJ
MKTNDLYDLQALRQVREQRASSHLAAQQQRCRDTHQSLDDAKEKLRLHREAIARKAEALYGRFSEGLSISAWQAAQDQLNELAEDRRRLEESVEQNAHTLDEQERERDAFRRAHLLRRRQAEACDMLLDTHLKEAHRHAGRREEADEMPAITPGGVA